MSQGLVEALMVLVPGFLSAIVYYSLTSHPKPSMFERVVQALVFTVVIWAIGAPLGEWLGLDLRIGMGESAGGKGLGPSVLLGVAVVVGLLAALVVDTDYAHQALRCVRMTKETSHPSEWYSTFYSRSSKEFVLLHLVEGRRLYGWPAEWPSDSERGHFRIENGEWLGEDNETHRAADVILIRVQDVVMVEFLQKQTTGESDGDAGDNASWWALWKRFAKERSDGGKNAAGSAPAAPAAPAAKG